jgi:GNAT superfamily N-acetyltransferase
MTEGEDIRIRRFRESDIEPLKQLVYATIDACYSGVYPEEAVRFFKEWHSDKHIREDVSRGVILILETAGQIVGTGTLVDDDIRRVFVAPDSQARGYGEAIMSLLEERARAAGIAGVALSASLPSKGFYDHLGYETLGEASIDVGNGKTLDFYKMKKSLEA